MEKKFFLLKTNKSHAFTVPWFFSFTLCSERIRRSKDQLEFNLSTAVEDNKNAFVDYTLNIYTLPHTFHKYINSKRRNKKNLHPFYWMWGERLGWKLRIRLRNEMPFLPQYLLVWPIVLRVHSPPSWKVVTGNEMKLLQSNRNIEVTYYTIWTFTSLCGLTAFIWGYWRSWQSAHQATLWE